MTLSENQRCFLQQQISFWTGLPLDTKMPLEQGYRVLGLTEANLTDDNRQRGKDINHNSVFWSKHYSEPVINQWLTDQVRECRLNEKHSQLEPLWPEGKKFAVCLTHDVDHINPCYRLNYAHQFRNILRGWVKRSINLTELIFRILAKPPATLKSKASRLGRQSIPFFDPWLTLEGGYGFRSTFFFLPERVSRYHFHDGELYQYQDRLDFEGQRITVTELMRELDQRGWEIGLHGSFYSFDDAAELKSQKEQIERSLKKEINSIRQHYLHWDSTKTPRAQTEAGFKYDSTLGLNSSIGFRNGLALPFYHYDLLGDIPLPLLQIPLHIQDGSLLRPSGLDLSPPLAVLRARELIDKVETNRGLITLSWHPHVCDERSYPGWFWVYAKLLQYIAQKDAWVATVQDIGEWWEQRRQKIERKVQELTTDVNLA